jgi:DNA ligase 1
MEYSKLAAFYDEINNTTKKLEKADILARLFKEAGVDLEVIVYLCQGKVFPLWDDRKIGFSSRLMIKAMHVALGISIGEIEKLLNKKGDLGKVSEELIKRKRQATLFKGKLTVKKVFDNIRKLADMEGEGTVNRKVQLVAELLTSADEQEVKYVVGTVLEEMRIGIAEGIVKDAIWKAFEVEKEDVLKAYDLLVDYGEVAELARLKKLKSVKLEPGRPVKVMLGPLAKDVEDGFKQVGKPCQAEFKFDGFRVQIHCKSNKIKLFTRRMEDVTEQFPDVVKNVGENVKAESYILDAEVVGYDVKNKKYLAFQKISQRIKRKYNISDIAGKFPVEVNVFDVIYYNGKNVMNEKFEERRKIIEKIINNKDKKIVVAKGKVVSSAKEAEEIYKEALKAGHEGVMFKSLKSEYRPGRYVGFMSKLKEVLETLDLIIVGAEWGEGKRAKWLSSYIIACRNKEDELIEIGRVSTGVKEKDADVTFKSITEELKKNIISEKGKELKLKPRLVVEVAFEEIQKSSKYASGYALRFPRVKRIRFDKGKSDVSSIDEILMIYKSQRGRSK